MSNYSIGNLAWVVVFCLVIGFALYLAVTGVRRFVRGFRAGLRGDETGKERPTLRSVLFKTVLVALLAIFVPLTVDITHNFDDQSFQNSQAMSQLQIALGTEGFIGPQPAPAISPGLQTPQAEATLESALRRVVEADSGGSGHLSLNDRSQAAASGLPAQAISLLRGRGWVTGNARLFGQLQRYVAWRTSKHDAVYYFGAPTAWYWALPRYTLTLIFGIGILSPVAAVAAWVLNRSIVKPVRQVSEASVVLADGGQPMEIPTRAPRELSVLAESFNRMAAKLRRAQDTERDFLMSVGHELKTPLTAIDGYAELLADGAVDAGQVADVLSDESARLRRLVGDLLDLARIDRSEFSVVDEPVDLAVTAGDVAQRYAALAATLGVKLEVDSDEPSPIRGDPGRLLQAASNLVENALRVTPSGGAVRVTVQPGLLSVSDSGPGLTDDDVAHAFERFYLHRKYSGPDVGTGLGLAIVKELAVAMGGSVSVSSTPGGGATFELRLRPDGMPAAFGGDRGGGAPPPSNYGRTVA